MIPISSSFCDLEYLTRNLRVIGEKTQFIFHSRCTGVKLKHLCFANDDILCSRDDFVVVYSMLQGFNHFSDASRLEVNVNKFEVYTSEMSNEKVKQIIDAFGFKLGKLPFKYLGVPICFKRIAIRECMNLVENDFKNKKLV